MSGYSEILPYGNPLGAGFENLLTHTPDELLVVSRRIPGSRQSIVILGSHHITDPEHWYYPIAADIFDKWEEDTGDLDRVIVAEGLPELWGRGPTEAESIRSHYSELGLLNYWAAERQVPVISGEPSIHDTLFSLLHHSRFPWEEICVFYGIEAMPMWYRMDAESRPSFRDYMDIHFNALRSQAAGDNTGWNNPDSIFRYEQFERQYQRYFKRKPNPDSDEDNELHLQYTSPHTQPGDFSSQPIARVGLENMALRDKHLVKLIESLKDENKSVFSWYGGYHVAILSERLGRIGELYPIARDLYLASQFPGDAQCPS